MSEVASPGKGEAAVDVKLMKALGHPIRQRILQELTLSKEASPSQIAKAIDEPLTNVGYHARVLVKCDAIELVRTEVSGSSVEHFYRPKVRPVVDEDNWRSIPENVRESLLDQTFQQIWKNVRAASEGDGLKDLRTVAAWSTLKLDDEAFAELSRMAGDLVLEALALQSGAESRLAELDDEERTAKTNLVELDLMLYPITDEPAPSEGARHPHPESGSTDSKLT